MNTKKTLLLFLALLSVLGMWATDPTPTYTITAAYSVLQASDQNGDYNVWCKDQRAITLTFSSTQDVASDLILYYELKPVDGEYTYPKRNKMMIPAITANTPLNKTYNFIEQTAVSDFTDGNEYKLSLYYVNPTNSEPTEKTLLTECTIKYVHEPQTITVRVADGATFDTFSSALNVDFSKTNNTDVIAAYTASYDRTTPNKVTLTRYKKVLPANNGVILYAPKTTKSQSFNVVATTSVTVDAVNKMVAVTNGANVETTTGQSFNYVVSGSDFSALSATTIIEGGKAYLSIERNPIHNPGSFSIIYDPTGIDEVQEEKTLFGDGQIYTIQGQKAGYLQPGQIYICNGKKVLVK